MNKEEAAIRTSSLLRLVLEHDQLISKAEFLQTLIDSERYALDALSNPTIEQLLSIDEVVHDIPPINIANQIKDITVENVETLEGVKDCLKQLSIKTNSRKISLEILRKFGVEKTTELDPAFYYRVCTMAIEELNEFMKNKAKSNDN